MIRCRSQTEPAMNEFFFGAALIITLVMVGSGIVIGLIGCMVLAILVMAGVMTSSTAIGVLRGTLVRSRTG